MTLEVQSPRKAAVNAKTFLRKAALAGPPRPVQVGPLHLQDPFEKYRSGGYAIPHQDPKNSKEQDRLAIADS